MAESKINNTVLQNIYEGDISSYLENGWVCPNDGIVIIRITSTGGETGYYIRDVTSNLEVGMMYDTSRANSTRSSTSFPVIKGHTYKQDYVAGASKAALYYKYQITGV